MRDLGTVLILVWWALPPAAAVAQPAAAQSVRGAVDSERKTGTYLKGGLAHWQGDISSQSLFTNWNVDQLGVAYDLTSANVELEAYFGDTFLQLSGFSIGYRKDVLRIADSGHLVYGGGVPRFRPEGAGPEDWWWWRMGDAITQLRPNGIRIPSGRYNSVPTYPPEPERGCTLRRHHN